MERRLLVIVASCLLVASASAGAIAKRKSRGATPRAIATGPLNTAIVAGNTFIELTCLIPPADVPTARVQWWEYGTTPSGAQISDMDVMLPGHPNNLRYSLNLTSVGQYSLHIAPVVPADGTYYNCVDANAAEPDQTQLGAQLVVIESQPNCTTTMAGPIVIEGDYYTMECIMYFRSSVGVKPLMTWTGPDPYLKAITNTNVSVWSGISFTVSRSMDSLSFTCITNFTQDGFGGPNQAQNIPTWAYQWRSPQLLVHWGPKNMYASPDVPDYDVGTVITCFADAFPAATYFWQNLDTHETWTSQSFIVRADMVGLNRMRCHAENYINSILYYNDMILNVNVNPVPTTPSPGPITTTTAPPAEAYCSDLTGQWQATNPTATMCIWIDYANNGVMTGLMRNDTETYWNDLYGRIQLNTFDQGGFASVAPGSIGVTAYAVECKACYGVETMIVSQLQRSETSIGTCGDAGVVNVLPDFTFYRVPRQSPCSSSPPP